MESLLKHPSGAGVDRFIPHRGRMKLLDTIVAFDRQQKSADISVRLVANAPYYVGDIFQSHWLIELMAQAGAVLSQVLRTETLAGDPPPGFLIAIRQFDRLDMRPLPPGTVLRVRAHFDVDLDPVGNCISSVFAADEGLIAQSEMIFISSHSGAV